MRKNNKKVKDYPVEPLNFCDLKSCRRYQVIDGNDSFACLNSRSIFCLQCKHMLRDKNNYLQR